MKLFRVFLLISALSIVFGYPNLHAQDYFITPPSVKKNKYADREVTFSEVTMNGAKTTYFAVEQGETIKIKTRIESKKIGDYCPACIVQIYWGINSYTSVCAKSFYGYNTKKKKSKHTFKAPMKDGIYYITMGSSLEYSCANNNNRPNCSADYAFAVIKVGNPDPDQKITIKKVKKDSNVFLKTEVIKSGAFGIFDKLEWFFEGEKLDYDGRTEIPATKFGNYKALWSNCLTSISESINHLTNDEVEIPPALVEDVSPVVVVEEIVKDSNDIEVLIETNDKFVLKHLNFDLNKFHVKPEGKEELDKLAKIMRNKPGMKILLEGHTALGNRRRNMILSEKRVKSTKAYLVQQGVEINRIDTKGWGQQKPLVKTRNKARGKINRRVEIQILAR